MSSVDAEPSDRRLKAAVMVVASTEGGRNVRWSIPYSELVPGGVYCRWSDLTKAFQRMKQHTERGLFKHVQAYSVYKMRLKTLYHRGDSPNRDAKPPRPSTHVDRRLSASLPTSSNRLHRSQRGRLDGLLPLLFPLCLKPGPTGHHPSQA